MRSNCYRQGFILGRLKKPESCFNFKVKRNIKKFYICSIFLLTYFKVQLGEIVEIRMTSAIAKNHWSFKDQTYHTVHMHGNEM